MIIETNDRPSRPDLTSQDARDYLAQLDRWFYDTLSSVKSEDGMLLPGWEIVQQKIMVEKAVNEDPRILPLIYAQLSARPDLALKASHRGPVGQQIQSEGLVIDGHTSDSTLWLIDGAANRMQSMLRLIVVENGELGVVDVYSDPVSPAYKSSESGEVINVDATKASRALHILQFAESHKASILGWLPIPEIRDQQVPSYSQTA